MSAETLVDVQFVVPAEQEVPAKPVHEIDMDMNDDDAMNAYMAYRAEMQEYNKVVANNAVSTRRQFLADVARQLAEAEVTVLADDTSWRQFVKDMKDVLHPQTLSGRGGGSGKRAPRGEGEKALGAEGEVTLYAVVANKEGEVALKETTRQGNCWMNGNIDILPSSLDAKIEQAQEQAASTGRQAVVVVPKAERFDFRYITVGNRREVTELAS